MATNILSIGQSALAAAQVGLNTTGHNIANAATPGYHRQVVVQNAALAQEFGFGFLGQGAEISTVKRVYSEFLGSQVRTAQNSKSALDTYYTEIRQIDNMLADPASGLSPALQQFFGGMQDLATNPASIPARQSALSSAEALAARFQSMDGRLQEIGRGINSQIATSVELINAYAVQIAQLNDAIGRAQGPTGQPPNDLLDQRDQLVLDLNKEIKTTVVKQGDGGYNVFIGNGQPLVVGVSTSRLVTVASAANPRKLEVAYQTPSGIVPIAQASLAGGKLGGLVQFRSQTLEPSQAALDTLAAGLASTFNDQHRLGQDLKGNPGGAFFTAATGAADFAVAMPDPRLIAAAAPIRTAAASANTGTGVISAGTVNAPPPPNANLQRPVTITFTSATTFDVSGTGTGNPTGLTYTPGATLSYNGWSATLNGTPSTGDSFTVSANTGGVGDNRNALLLGALQSANVMSGGTTTYQGAYSQLVSQIGNKTRELEVTSSAAGKLLTETTLSLNTESGVNLDEEATNLLRYQQAYQAAGKVMQIASDMFDILVSLGR